MATSVCDPSTPEPTEFSDAADELRARFRAFQEQAHAKSQEEEEEEEEKAGKNTTNANKPSKKAPHKTRAKQHAKSTKKNKKRTPAATARARKRAGPDPAGATPARKRRRKQDLVDLGRFREYLATVPAEEFARLQDVFITDFGARRSLRQEQQPQKDEAEGGTRNEYYASALCKFAAENHNVSVRGIADENKCNGKYVDKNRRLPDATYVYVGRKNPRFPHAEPDAVFSPFLHAVS